MSGDPLQHVQSGDPLAIRAETFNCLIDAARDFKQRTRHLGRAAKSAPANPTVVSVRNDSGSDQPRFAVLGLDRPIILPADNESEFTSRATAVGVLPTTDHVGRWCVLAEPLASGAIGRAYLLGLIPAMVHVADEEAGELDRCEVRDGVAGLEMVEGGSATVVWKEAGTGDVWALILPGGPPPRGIRSVTMVDTVEEKAWDFDTSGEATLDETGETITVVAGDQFTGVALQGHRAWAAPPEPGESDWRLVDGGTTFLVAIADDDIAQGADGPATISGAPSIGVTVKASLHGCSDGELLYCWWDSPGGGHWDFLRDTSAVEAGCGLDLESGILSVVPGDLVGFGLRETDDAEDCRIEVDTPALAGCGLITEGVGQPLKFDRASVAGFGLVPGNGTCDLDVDFGDLAGCGLLQDGVGTPLRISPSALAGFGLVPGNGTCDLDVDPTALAGCGLLVDGAGQPLKFDAGGVAGFGLVAVAPCVLAVDAAQLAGCGLIGNVVTGQLDVVSAVLAGPGLVASGLCGLQVNVGCGLAIVGDAVVFDAAAVAGDGLAATGTCALRVNVGCGIKLELGAVAFDAGAVAGLGLSGAGCFLHVNAGGGLEIVGDTVVVRAGCSLIVNGEDDSLEVDVSTLAGDGLIASAGPTCDELAVQPGCGLEIAANKSVQIKRSHLLGDGLKAGDGSPCELAVDWEDFPGGCGLVLNGEFWDVDNETLAGEGLVAGIGCSLAVNTGCGLAVNAGFVEFDPDAIAGGGLVGGIGCSLDVDLGCGLKLDGNAVAVDPGDLGSADVGPTGAGCGLETKGASCSVTVVTDVAVDEYGDLVLTKRTLAFSNGLLKDCDA